MEIGNADIEQTMFGWSLSVYLDLELMRIESRLGTIQN